MVLKNTTLNHFLSFWTSNAVQNLLPLVLRQSLIVYPISPQRLLTRTAGRIHHSQYARPGL
jgi:hypothetical protein